MSSTFFPFFQGRAQRASVESRKRRSVQGAARFGLAVVAGGASGTKHVKGLGPARRCQACRLPPPRSCQRSDRVPETRPCPLPANQSERADLGERCGGVVTPAARVVRVRQQLGRRAAVASSLRATLHDSPRRSCGRPIKAGEVGSSDARKHRGIFPCGRSQRLRFSAASSVAFVPGLPQLGRAARSHAAGVASCSVTAADVPRVDTAVSHGAAPAGATGRVGIGQKPGQNIGQENRNRE